MATTQTSTTIVRESGYHGSIATVSLALGPLLMAVGDLLHPPESTDVAQQAGIIAQQPGRWYLAHLLLLIGFGLFLPGLLALTASVAARWPRTAQLARVLILIGAAGLSAIFAVEAVAGRLAVTDEAATKTLLDALFSWQMAVPIFAIGSVFFVGSAVLTVLMIRGVPPLRWPAVVMLVGILLIIAEIVSAQVVLSQAGNVLVWVGAVGCAWQLHRNKTRATVQDQPPGTLLVQ